MKSETKASTIRALDRGLIVIEVLSRKGRMSLAELRQHTGLPNPTLLRILGTLQQRSWVTRNIVEGLYELSHSIGVLLSDSAHAHPLAEICAGTILGLKSHQLGIPSDISAIVEPGRIEIVESTRLRGPMAPSRTGLGLRPSLVFSGHGRATLAFSPPDVRKRHLEAIAEIGSKEDRLWLESGQLEAEIEETRRRGFGLRQANYWEPAFDPGPELGALAIPIISQSGIHGTISLLWIIKEMSLDEILAAGYLNDLRTASAKIGIALDRAGISPPLV